MTLENMCVCPSSIPELISILMLVSLTKFNAGFLVGKVRLRTWLVGYSHSFCYCFSSYILYAKLQTAKLLLQLCHDIDKLNRNFLWGDVEDHRRLHLVNWDTVCQPKAIGGLGIKKTSYMNQAMLAKASWRIAQNDSGLWKDIYNAKYLHSNTLTSLAINLPLIALVLGKELHMVLFC